MSETVELRGADDDSDSAVHEELQGDLSVIRERFCECAHKSERALELAICCETCNYYCRARPRRCACFCSPFASLFIVVVLLWVWHSDPGLLGDWAAAVVKLATNCGWSYVVYDHALIGRSYALVDDRRVDHQHFNSFMRPTVRTDSATFFFFLSLRLHH